MDFCQSGIPIFSFIFHEIEKKAFPINNLYGKSNPQKKPGIAPSQDLLPGHITLCLILLIPFNHLFQRHLLH